MALSGYTNSSSGSIVTEMPPPEPLVCPNRPTKQLTSAHAEEGAAAFDTQARRARRHTVAASWSPY